MTMLLSLSILAYFGSMTSSIENQLYSYHSIDKNECCPTKNTSATDALVSNQERYLKPNSEKMRDYAEDAGYNTKYGIIVDYSIPSYRNRFYVMDLQSGQVVNKTLVAHGDCKNDDYKEVNFSNVPESNCSSQGLYTIGKKYNGAWGTSYRLHGLEETNDNALARGVVFHAISCIPERENGQYICTSLGCPMVSPTYFSNIQNLIDNSENPILFWIYKYN